MIPFEKPEPTGIAIIDRIFQRIVTTLQSLARAVTNDNLLVVTFEFASTDVQMRHGLKAPVKTLEVVYRNEDVIVWVSSTVNPSPR